MPRIPRAKCVGFRANLYSKGAVQLCRAIGSNADEAARLIVRITNASACAIRCYSGTSWKQSKLLPKSTRNQGFTFLVPSPSYFDSMCFVDLTYLIRYRQAGGGVSSSRSLVSEETLVDIELQRSIVSNYM